MTVGISSDESAKLGANDLARWLREPITQGLLLSLALHLVIAIVLQAAPATNGRHTVVINARLQPLTSPAEHAPARREQVLEPVVEAKTQRTADSSSVTASPPPASDRAQSPTVLQTPAPSPMQSPPAAPVVTAAAPSALPADAPPALATTANPLPGPPQATGLPTLPVGIDTNWYLARQVDSHPKVIGRIEPAYPEEAKRRNIEGTLKLMLKIDDLGRVQSAEVVEATPSGMFDDAALAAFRGARFLPAMKEGRPVRYQAYIRVDFKLKD